MFNCKSNLILSFHNSSDKINIRKTIRPCKCNRLFILFQRECVLLKYELDNYKKMKINF